MQSSVDLVAEMGAYGVLGGFLVFFFIVWFVRYSSLY